MKIRWAGACAAALLLSLASSRVWADIKVGITISATGPGSALGQPQLKTGPALPKEIAGEKITYIILDDESDPTKGTQNARRLVLEQGVDAIVGSSLTPVTLPIIDIASESKTPMVTLAAATSIVQPMDDKRKWVFKVVPNDDIMVSAILKRIVKSGVRTLGYIGVSDGYGEGYYKELSRIAPELGLTLTTHEVYARSDMSTAGQALKTIVTNPDAVFIASAGTPAVLPQKDLRERGYIGQIYQTHGVATDEFIKLGGADVDGAIFAGEAFTIADDLDPSDPLRRATDEFITAYKAANGAKPNIFGAHLWDAVALITRAIPNALKSAKPGTPEFRAALRDELEQGKNVYLNNGLSNMSPTNHNGYDERSAFLIKVDGGKFRLLK